MKNTVLILLLLIFGSCFSQKTIQNQRVWVSYTGQYKISKKWGCHIEAQFRFDNHLQQNLQNAIRVGGIYFLSSTETLITGYALVNALNVSADKFYKESRIWEQYQLNKKWNDNKNTIIHRLRLEQRWVEQLATSLDENNSTNYQNRFRYLNRNLFHITYLKSSNEEIYAIVQDEIFLTLGNNKINSNSMDQNRFSVGLGLNCNNNIRAELSYINQFVTSNSGINMMNHVVSVSLFQNLDLKKH